MKTITVLAAGTRGDVQPFIALAHGLSQAGHRVRVVTNGIYADWLQSYNLEMRPLSWDPRAAMRLQNQLAAQKNPLVYVREQTRNTHHIYSVIQRESFAACRGTDYLVVSILSPWGISIAEKMNIPLVAGLLHPLVPTRAFPMQLIPTDLGGTLNWASHILAEHLMQLATGGEINAFRSTIGLAPYRFPVTLLGDLRGRNVPLLCNLSPTIIPRPCDWPESIHMDGYWFLPAPAAWTPPQALIDFLAQGDAPIYIGFGSTLTDHAEETGRIVIEALRQINRRGVLAKGWGALPEAGLDPQHFIVIDEVPHDWLFPQMAAVVHHGGAGTTAAAFHAGVPQLVIPHMQDQPYWGNKTFQLGVGAKPLPRTHLSVASLANTLQSIFDNPSISIRAKEFGARIRSEKGLEKMVAVIEHTFNP